MNFRKTDEFKSSEIGPIPIAWDLKEISSISTVIGGGTPATKKTEYWGGNIPWLTPKDLSGYTFRYIGHGERSITEEGLNNSNAKIVPTNSILLTTRAPIGYLALAKNQLTTNQGFHSLIPKAGIHPLFLFYLLENNVERLKSSANGSTFGEVSGSTLKSLKFAIPEMDEQIRITEILASLDSKIELNQQTNKTLESIAQAIFKHWFIDFEFPDENGQPYKSSGGEMVDSELGEIPKGWEVLTLEDYGTFKNGINYLRDESGDTTFFIANVRNIANNRLLLKTSLDQINVNLNKAKEYFLRDKDILIARSASPGEVCLVLGDLENVIYSGFSIRYRLNNPSGYLYIFLIMQKLKKRLSNYSVGTTLQSINQETLKKLMFILPSSGVLSRFNMIGEQLLKKTYNNMVQNYGLSQIRDLLLPKLMSGFIICSL